MSDVPPPLPNIGTLDWGLDLNNYLTWLTDRAATPGPQGPTGPIGPQGPPGPPGPTATGNISTYLYSFNAGSPPPNNGQIRLDNTDQTLVTHVYVRDINSDGVDLTNLMAQITDTSRIYLQDKDDAAAWQSYHILGPGIDVGGYFDFAVERVGGGNPLPSQGQGSPCLLAFTSATQPLPSP